MYFCFLSLFHLLSAWYQYACISMNYRDARCLACSPLQAQLWCWWSPFWTPQTLSLHHTEGQMWHSQRQCLLHRAQSPCHGDWAADSCMHTFLGTHNNGTHMGLWLCQVVTLYFGTNSFTSTYKLISSQKFSFPIWNPIHLKISYKYMCNVNYIVCEGILFDSTS